MAITKTKITGDIALPDGTIPSQSSVTFTMTGFDTDAVADATIAPRSVTSVLSDAGALDVDLWSNEDGERTTFYNVRLNIYNGNSPKIFDVGKIEVPTTGGPYDLNDLLPIAPPSGATVDEYIAQLAASVAAAEAAETAAMASEVAAAASADEAALYDGVRLDDVAALIADSSLTYTASQPGTVAAGDIVRTRSEGFSYKVASSGSTDNHVETSGGVKLYVVPLYGTSFPEYPFGATGADNSGAVAADDEYSALSATILAQGGGGVSFGSGRYKFNQKHDLSNNIRLRGRGDITTLVAGVTGMNIFEGLDSEPLINAVVEDLGFEGFDTFVVGDSQAIRVRAYQGLTIQRCSFTKFQVAAVIAGVTATSGTEVYEDLKIHLNKVDGGGNAVPFSGIHVYHADRFSIRYNYVTRVARGIDLEMNAGSVARNGIIRGNVITGGSLSDHSSTNTYYGIHLATDSGTSEGFENILIDANTTIDGVHDDGAGGAASNFGADLSIRNISENLGTGIEVRSHTSIGFHSDTSDLKSAVSVQLCPGIKIGRILAQDPKVAGTSVIRVRDCANASYDEIVAEDGASINWGVPVIEQRSSLTAPMRLQRGRIVASSQPTLLDDLDESVSRSGLSRVIEGSTDISSTTTNNEVIARTLYQGDMRTGTVIKIRSEGQFIGTAGTKSIGVRFNGGDIGVFTVTPGNGDGFVLESTISIRSSLTGIDYVTTLSGIGSVSFANQDAGGNVTGLDFANNDYDLGIVAWVADAADTIRARISRMEVQAF